MILGIDTEPPCIEAMDGPRTIERSDGSMKDAIELARSLWDGKETVRILPTPTVLHLGAGRAESLRTLVRYWSKRSP